MTESAQGDPVAALAVAGGGVVALDEYLQRLSNVAPPDIARSLDSIRNALDLKRLADSADSAASLALAVATASIAIESDLIAVDTHIRTECGSLPLFGSAVEFPPNHICSAFQSDSNLDFDAILSDPSGRLDELVRSVEEVLDGKEAPDVLVGAFTGLRDAIEAGSFAEDTRTMSALGGLAFDDLEIPVTDHLANISTASEEECGFAVLSMSSVETIRALSPRPAPNADRVVIGDEPYGECDSRAAEVAHPRSLLYWCDRQDGSALVIQVSMDTGRELTRTELPPTEIVENPGVTRSSFVTRNVVGRFGYEKEPAEGLNPEREVLVVYRAPLGGTAERVEFEPPEPPRAGLDFRLVSILADTQYGVLGQESANGVHVFYFLDADGNLRSTEALDVPLSGPSRSMTERLYAAGGLIVDLDVGRFLREGSGDLIRDFATGGLSDQCAGVAVTSATRNQSEALFYFRDSLDGVTVTPLPQPTDTSALVVRSGVPNIHGVAFYSEGTLEMIGTDNQVLWSLPEEVVRRVGHVGGRLFVENQSQQWINVDPRSGTEVTNDPIADDLAPYIRVVNSAEDPPLFRSSRDPDSGELIIMSSDSETGLTVRAESADYCNPASG